MSVKIIFFPFAVIVLVWVVIGVVKPGWDDYKKLKAETIKLEGEKQTLETGIANIKKALTVYQGLDNNIKTYVNNALPVDTNDDNLVAELNKGISQSGTIVTKIGAGGKKVRRNTRCNKNGKDNVDCAPKAATTGITLSTVSNYSSVKNLLNKLDTQNRIIVPTQLDLSVANDNQKDEEESSDIQFVNAKLSFDVFHKKSVKVKSFASVMTTDLVLRSLLQKGLSMESIADINDFITSEVFMPVHVEGAGKDDLFALSE